MNPISTVVYNHHTWNMKKPNIITGIQSLEKILDMKKTFPEQKLTIPQRVRKKIFRYSFYSIPGGRNPIVLRYLSQGYKTK